MDISQLSLDGTLEKDGARFDYDDELYFIVRPSSYRPFQKELAAAMERKTRSRRGGKRMEAMIDVGQDVTPTLVAKHLVTGWGGLTSNGKPVEFSREKALEILPSAKLAIDCIKDFSDDTANYAQQEKEAVAKKLKAV